MTGKLFFIYGAMNSGKSMHLLAKAHNFEERGIPFLLLKTEIDNRDGEGVICSRAIGSKKCLTINDNTNILNMIEDDVLNKNKELRWILVDESQFLTEKQIDELSDIVDLYGINVICYGLRTDFKTKLFPGSRRLLEIADSIEELKCSCYCGRKAIYNARLDNDGNIVTTGNQVEIGGNDRYVSLCRKCYKNKINLIM